MRTLTKALAIWLVALAGPVVAANPFAPAITVNNGVITSYDIEQRMKLLEALGASGDLRKLATQQLTEDRVKEQAAKSLDIELPEGAITTGVEEFASSRGLTMEDVNLALSARGIDQQAMNDFVRSGLLWREVIGQRFRARSTPSEADIDAGVKKLATQPRDMMTLAEIALPFGELGEAETMALADRLYGQLVRGASFPALALEYSRSDSAENGGVIPAIPADRLPASFRTQVLVLSPGQVTRPIPISGGVAILKLVSVARVPPDVATIAASKDPATREQIRQQLFAERIGTFGQGYLQELLGDALIVER